MVNLYVGHEPINRTISKIAVSKYTCKSVLTKVSDLFQGIFSANILKYYVRNPLHYKS